MRLGIISLPSIKNIASVHGCIQMYSLISSYNFTNDVTLNVTPDFLQQAKSLINKGILKERYIK